PVPVDPVLRDVRAEIRAGGDAGRLRVPGVGHLDERARPRVALAEDEEVVGLGPREDDQVGLHVPGREPRRASRVPALPDRLTDLLRRLPELHGVASSSSRGHYGVAPGGRQRPPPDRLVAAALAGLGRGAPGAASAPALAMMT